MNGSQGWKARHAFESVRQGFEGVRHGQNMTLAAVVGVGAILGGLLIYILQRIDNLPHEFQGLTHTVAQNADVIRNDLVAVSRALLGHTVARKALCDARDE
jgi:hypothetical protein